MDCTEKLTVLSLCSGYGGIELGIERVLGELSVLAHVEIEAFAIANLVDKMETGRMVPAPIWSDLKTFPAEIFRGKVSILTGGYPCQPFSAAGKRQGENDPRHLFPYIKTIIERCEPGMCFFENVDGHVSMGLSTVISDLEEMGYETTWGVFSAAEVGAPHQRKRVFILARRELANSGSDAGCSQQWEQQKELPQELQRGDQLAHRPGDRRGESSEVPQRWEPKSAPRCENYWPSRPGEPQHEWEEPRVVADDKHGRLERVRVSKNQKRRETNDAPPQSTGRGCLQGQTQPQLGRTPDGVRDRVDRLRLLGNGVVPQTAEKAFRTLLKRFR